MTMLLQPRVLALPLLLALPATTMAARGGASANSRASVSVCHQTGDGSYQLLSVNENAEGAHLGHGDVAPGAYYPDTDGDGWGDFGSEPSDCPSEGTVDNNDDCGDGGAASGPDVEEIEDGIDNDCDGWVDEGFVCPCFDADSLDDRLDGWDVYALSWNTRYDGLTDVYSLRGYAWGYNEDDDQWQAPTIGADVYRATAEGGAPYCETWSQTWLAAPDHEWADDAQGTAVPLPEESYAVCRDVLDTWVSDFAVDLTSY
jgi:hypothetical protein